MRKWEEPRCPKFVDWLMLAGGCLDGHFCRRNVKRDLVPGLLVQWHKSSRQMLGLKKNVLLMEKQDQMGGSQPGTRPGFSHYCAHKLWSIRVCQVLFVKCEKFINMICWLLMWIW